MLVFGILCYSIWVVCVVTHQMYKRVWTRFTYPLAYVFVLLFGTPEILVGLAPGASVTDVVTTWIWCHLAGSLLNPWILFLTVTIPLLIFRIAKR
jgi:hypothetical protein